MIFTKQQHDETINNLIESNLNIETEKLTNFIKSMKNDIKRARKKEKRKYSLFSLIEKTDDSFFLFRLLTSNFYFKRDIEIKRAEEFINNEKEAEKAGWYSRKPDQNNLLTWADKAYPNIDTETWDAEYEKNIAEKILNSQTNKM